MLKRILKECFENSWIALYNIILLFNILHNHIIISYNIILHQYIIISYNVLICNVIQRRFLRVSPIMYIIPVSMLSRHYCQENGKNVCEERRGGEKLREGKGWVEREKKRVKARTEYFYMYFIIMNLS